MKRLTSILLVFALLLSMIPTAFAATETESGTPAAYQHSQAIKVSVLVPLAARFSPIQD